MKYKKWDEWYSIAKQLYKDVGTINVPSNFIYMDSKIGDWISIQRGHFRRGSLSDNCVKLLNDLGINWEGRDVLRQARNDEFIKNIELLKRYIEENGDTRVPRHFMMDGTDLGQWASNIRNILRGKTKRTLSDDQRGILEELGFETDWYREGLDKKWNRYYALLKEYYEKNPEGIVAEDTIYRDVNLGQWVKAQRAAYRKGKLAEDRIEALQKLGINLSPQDTIWDEKYAVAKKFYEEFHHLDIPNSMIIDGVKIGSWISNQRQAYNGSRKDIVLSAEQIARLESIGMNWSVSNMGRTSFAEQALFYYLRMLFPDLENNFTEFGFELDLYIPSQKIAFEYDGEYWHRTKYEEDNRKDAQCEELGISLVRIRELGLEDTYYAHCYHRNDDNENDALSDLYKQIIWDLFKERIILGTIQKLGEKFGNSERMLTVEELIKIIIPLSGCHADLEDYANFVFRYRCDELNISDWPDCCEGANDKRIAREYFLFLSNYGYLIRDDENYHGNITERYLINETIADEIAEILSKPITDESLQQALIDIRTTDIVSQVARKTISTSQYRPKQAQFRHDVLAMCKRCIITNVQMPEILEAAHIKPHKYSGPEDVDNGFAMRTDIHILFDTGNLRISVDGDVELSEIARSNYGWSIPPKIVIPDYVNKNYLQWRWENYVGI